jgi:hypothetical protein
MIRRLVSLFTLLFAASQISAQQKTLQKLSPDLIHYFAGAWEGKGEFANGRKIEADLIFTMPLDSAWLNCSHVDRLPNNYKASLMWGCDKKTGRFLAYNFDNFQGHRQFESAGWVDHKLVLSNSQEISKTVLAREHFIYEQIDDNSFRMTYETNIDGQSWNMIDYIVFKRKL